MTDPARAPAIEQPVPPPTPSIAGEPDCPDPAVPTAPGDSPVAFDSGNGNGAGPDTGGGCTQAQLRRFVKSRPYVPLHELRRRFGLGGPEDEVSPIPVDGRTLFVGLADREAGLLGELIRGGDVGYELMLDPDGPMIVGVWPMRPVQRS